MRFVGVDLGARRVGLAVSDATATLATPWQVLPAGPTPAALVDRIADAIATLEADGGVAGVVVGVPKRLDGRDTDQTGPARTLLATLADRLGLPAFAQDERLTSREAESRLAVRERDWRKRKAKLDAAAAAVILQDFLDERPRRRPHADDAAPRQ